MARWARSADIIDATRAINAMIVVRRNPQLEAMLALAQPPRRITRRVSVYRPPVNIPQPIRQRRNSAPTTTAMIPTSPPIISRAQLLQSLGMANLLSLDSDEDVSFFT